MENEKKNVVAKLYCQYLLYLEYITFAKKEKKEKLLVLFFKTFPENWDSKAPSVGTLLAYLETTA